VVVFAGDTDSADAVWGDVVAGVVPADGSDLMAVQDALAGGFDGDRAEADALAARAADGLAQLARAGTDVSAALAQLAAACGRRDGVSIAAMHALGTAGTAAEADSLTAVLGDAERSDSARVAAADALGEICGRARANDTGDRSWARPLRAVFGALGETVADRGGASLDVRRAAARALARLPLTPARRASLLGDMRVDLSE